MKVKKFLSSVFFIGLALALVGSVGPGLAQGPEPQEPLSPQDAVGTAFTYQGRLTDDGSLGNGNYDFEFKLYDDASTQVGSTITVDDKIITDGLFTVELDFGSGAFNGEARYLEIGVRPGSSTGAYTTLSPRQALTPAPYALALPGLWTQQNITSTNLIGGYSGNSVRAGVIGATIGGGGESGNENRVTDGYGTVGGGKGNVAGYPPGWDLDDGYATVAGGCDNTASGYYAAVGGGHGNSATGWAATIGGGTGNSASDSRAIIGGGSANHASGIAGTVGGGHYNQATADYATISGGGGDSSATGNRVTDDYGTVGGGHDNLAGDDAGTTDDKPYATVGGGYSNTASGYDATVGGGYSNTASGSHATVGGGYSNTASAANTTVSGGSGNAASSASTTVGGGYGNTASGDFATVGGGADNTASGWRATVGGGNANAASGSTATVGGGSANTASGNQATIPGGAYNIAQGDSSFAAGQRAQANAKGCFVWGDSTFADVECNDNNRWVARAGGGVYFYTNSDLTSGMYLSAGGSSWNAVSDRDLKENLEPVDAQELLARLDRIPITTWNYKAQDSSIRHIGPMADDFNALVEGLGGEGEDYINTLDADGLALAAIQRLYQLSQEQALRIEELEAENAAQQEQIDDLEARVAALETASANSPQPLQSSLLPGAGALLAGLGLVWVVRRGSILKPPEGGDR